MAVENASYRNASYSFLLMLSLKGFQYYGVESAAQAAPSWIEGKIWELFKALCESLELKS